MKLDALKVFHEQLDQELSAATKAIKIFYLNDGRWYELLTGTVCTPAEVNHLGNAKKEKIAHQVPSGLDTWFYLPNVNAVVCLSFSQSPQKGKRATLRTRILKIHESATNAYKVSHNPLTQLLARDAFREKLAVKITELEKPSTVSSAEVQEGGVSRTLAVLALDIDHFKQVNDTWGHLYGDQVLKAFGLRLEKCADAIRLSGTGNVQINLGHPSGEEFLVLIEACALRDQFVDWANDFRRAISDDVMPSDKEWLWLASGGGTGTLKPPPLQERGTTASIGLAMHKSTVFTSSGVDAVSDLLDRADTALYRAKAAGRNQVIPFDEILSNCGRILEQDAKTRVVAIDIGSNVGVITGQEFKVYLPTFTGKTPFFINDGRTKRTLGQYPRFESARIVAFNVQPEISFAYVADPTDPVPTLDTGSHLEVIPTGSIGHLLPSFSKYFPSTPHSKTQGGIEDLEAFVKKDSENGSPFAIVVRFTRDADYLRQYGSVALNMALAQLYREARISFNAANAVEVLDRGSICIVGTKERYEEELVHKFVDEMASELPELSIVAGVFCDDDSIAKAEENKLNSANAIEFARLAASETGRNKDERSRHFNYLVACSILQALKDDNSLEIAYADFQRLRMLGVESSSLLNLGGLIAYSLSLIKEAKEIFFSGMNKYNNELILKSNYAVTAYLTNEIDPALKILNNLPIKEIDRLYELHSYGYLIYACLLSHAKLHKSQMYDATRFAHIAKKALKIPEFEKSIRLTVIRNALQAE